MVLEYPEEYIVNRKEEVKDIELVSSEHGEGFQKFRKVKEELQKNEDEIIKILSKDTNYNVQDCKELFTASIVFLDDIEQFYQEIFNNSYDWGAKDKDIRVKNRPKGKSLIITPQNAFLPLSVMLTASSLVAGNSVLLKPSTRHNEDIYKVLSPFTKHFPERFRIVRVSSKKLIDSKTMGNIDVVHYTGSSEYYENIGVEAIKSKTDFYVEGEGNGLFIIDDNLEKSVDTLLRSLTRCNGRLCTTPSGILVKEEHIEEFRYLLKERVDNYSLEVDMEGITEYAIEEFGNEAPLILEPQEEVISREIYGPAAWLDTWEDKKGLEEFLDSRTHGLNITVFTSETGFFRHKKAQASRYCFNTDPTDQSPFEPWGALGKSGQSPGNTCVEKFTRKTIELR